MQPRSARLPKHASARCLDAAARRWRGARSTRKSARERRAPARASTAALALCGRSGLANGHGGAASLALRRGGHPVLDLGRHRHKGLLNVGRALGARLHEGDRQRVGKLLRAHKREGASETGGKGSVCDRASLPKLQPALPSP
eukprot:611911-Pleurochrysis_carterae.AAC.2